jgi:hypothetical protein
MVDVTVEHKERNVARASITQLQGITGKISGQFKMTHEFKGAGNFPYSAGDISNNTGLLGNGLLGSLTAGDAKLPSIHKYMLASGFDCRGVAQAALTSINFPTWASPMDGTDKYIPVGSKVYVANDTIANLKAMANSATVIALCAPQSLRLATPIRITRSEQAVINYYDLSYVLSDANVGGSLNAADGTAHTTVFTYEFNGVETVVGFASNGASSPSYIGYVYTPTSKNWNYLTIRNEEDQFQRTIYGAMGDLNISLENSGMAMFEFDFKGMVPVGFIVGSFAQDNSKPQLPANALIKFSSTLPVGMDVADFVVNQKQANYSNGGELWISPLNRSIVEASKAQALIPTGNVDVYVLTEGSTVWTKYTSAAVAYTLRKVTHATFTQTAGVVYDTTVPPTMKNANLIMDGFRPAFTKVDLKIANAVALRQSGNSGNGYLSAIINERKPSVTIDPELMGDEAYDFYAKWFAGDTAALEFSVDNGQVGNRLYFYAKKAQYKNGANGDRDGIDTISVDADLVGSTLDQDDELLILVY